MRHKKKGKEFFSFVFCFSILRAIENLLRRKDKNGRKVKTQKKITANTAEETISQDNRKILDHQTYWFSIQKYFSILKFEIHGKYITVYNNIDSWTKSSKQELKARFLEKEDFDSIGNRRTNITGIKQHLKSLTFWTKVL